ncbi:MAG: aminodeoxychorismate synthase component I [Myxococcaceae bacterium]
MRALQRASVVRELEGAPEPWQLVELYRDDPWLALLESTGEVTHHGRYAFLCVDPFWVFQSKRAECFSGPPSDLQRLEGDPLDELAQLLEWGQATFSPETEKAACPLMVGGFVGYLGYELLYLMERVPDVGLDDLALPDSSLVLFHTIIAHDRQTGRSWVASHGFASELQGAQRDAEARSRATLERISGYARSRDDDAAWREQLRARREALLSRRPRLTSGALAQLGVRPVLDEPAYLDVVRRAKEHIFAGDVFEVCTTNRFETNHTGSGLELYRHLRVVNEAPFSAYLRSPDVEILSASPERFVSLDREGWAETRPIKGTRPRGRTPEEDRAWYDELARSEKDRAENVMIADLARNDLGRVCELGTVSVPSLQAIESYAFTHQLVSTVRGHLRPGRGPVELLRAAFPGGSMTGAPKVEAMKIIEQLEPVKRGIYSGSIGYFGFDGTVDLSIVIRTFVKKGERLTFHVGGAVVADSEPEAEHQELLDKAHGLVVALELAP